MTPQRDKRRQSGSGFFGLLAACLALLCLQPALAAGVVLVSDGQNPAPVYFASPADKAAATDLASYLGKMSGAKFVASALPAPAPTRGIIVGRSATTPGEGLAPDAFCIRAEQDRLFIVGGSANGSAYGVYALLEKLGCRWWSRDEEDVPPLKTIEYPAGESTVSPVFSIHDLYNREAQHSEGRFASKIRSKSTEDFVGGHSLYPLLTPYAEKHPEIYPANKKGERKGNKLHFCYLAPGIAEALADALSEQIEKRQRNVKDPIYFAGMGDWYGGMCECDKCQALYKAETWTDPDGVKKPGYTATLLTMINKTAEILEKKYPGVRIGTFAYMSLEAPPATIVPRENVIIRVPRLRHCTVHAADQCNKNRSFVLNLQQWCKLAPGRVYVWEYGANFASFVRPFPCLESMTANLRLYAKMGVRGVEIQGNYSSTGGDLAVLKNYVMAKVMADPTVDTRATLAGFCKGYYGPASEEMLAYVDTLEKSVREPTPICANEFAGPSYLTKEVVARMKELREQALAKVQANQPYERRVREATVSLAANRLWRPGPLEEQGDKLIRKDLDQYTYPDALEVVKYLRGSGVTEWSSGRAQQLAFLVLQGGPLATLTSSRLMVKVAPVLNGQIRQISFDGKDLLYVEKNASTKGYPQLGGSREALNTRAMEMVGAPTGTRVSMRGDGGVSLWGGVSTNEIRKTIELGEDGMITSRATRVLTAKETDDRKGANVTTSYVVGKSLAGVVVEYESGDKWIAATPSAAKPTIDLPRTKALRITLPRQGCVVLDRITTPSGTGGAAKSGAEPEEAVAKGVTTEDADGPVEAPTTAAAPTVGSVAFDEKAGTLTTSLHTSVALNQSREQVVFERKIKIDPLTK